MTLKALILNRAVATCKNHPDAAKNSAALLLVLAALKTASHWVDGDLSKLVTLAKRSSNLSKGGIGLLLIGTVWAMNKKSVYETGKQQYSTALVSYPRPTMTLTTASALMVLNKLTSGRARLSYKQLGLLGTVWGLGPTAYNHRDKIMSVLGKWKLILGTVAAVKGFGSLGGFNLLKKLFSSTQPQRTQQEHSEPSPQVKEVKQDPKPDPQESSQEVQKMVEEFKKEEEPYAWVDDFEKQMAPFVSEAPQVDGWVEDFGQVATDGEKLTGLPSVEASSSQEEFEKIYRDVEGVQENVRQHANIFNYAQGLTPRYWRGMNQQMNLEAVWEALQKASKVEQEYPQIGGRLTEQVQGLVAENWAEQFVRRNVEFDRVWKGISYLSPKRTRGRANLDRSQSKQIAEMDKKSPGLGKMVSQFMASMMKEIALRNITNIRPKL